ncbi:Os01g0372100, partial [Oryza sativa Japonica Group]
DDGRRHHHCAAVVSSSLAFHYRLSTPIPSLLSFIPFHAVVWWERKPRRRCSGARTGRRHRDIVFVAVEPEQAEPSHRTINISSVSSLKSLMNPCQWCSELGDRHRLPQFRPSSSTFDFSLSGSSAISSRRRHRARLPAVAESFCSWSSLSGPRQVSLDAR